MIIQHLGPASQSALANLLVKTTPMPVLEIRDRIPIESNHVYVLTPNYDVILEDRKLRLVRRPVAERLHMPIDHFFQSLAAQEKERAVGVVLSGSGSDGTLGLRAIKGEGGLTFAEDDTTAKYFAMPNSAIVAGCVDVIRSAKDIALELEAIARHPYVRRTPAADSEEVKFSGFSEGADALTKVFYLIKQQMGVNFAQYEHSTLRRRIVRRMILLQRETLDDYVSLLRSDAQEIEQLFNDILINVTSFFGIRRPLRLLRRKSFQRSSKRKRDGAISESGCPVVQRARRSIRW